MIEVKALESARGLEPTASNLEKIGGEFSPEVARWAFLQWDLRKRGAAKFSKAAEMLFDREGLEMATHEVVAAYHASLFPSGSHVVDLTAGIGADAVALARRGPVTAFELDPDRVEYLEWNLRAHGVTGSVRLEDCLSAAWDADYAFADPARREEGRRFRHIEQFSPDPRVLAERFRVLRKGVMKLSPMVADSELEGFGGGLEFVSFGGECREALVVLGREVERSRGAVHVESGERLEAGDDPYGLPEVRSFLFEADPAAIRAHCLGSLCERFGVFALGDSNGYLTGDTPVASVWLSCFEVLACHRGDVKRTRSELRRLEGGTPVIKSRGVKVDVEALRRQLRGEGEELVVVVFPVGNSVRHAVCRRVG